MCEIKYSLFYYFIYKVHALFRSPHFYFTCHPKCRSLFRGRDKSGMRLGPTMAILHFRRVCVQPNIADLILSWHSPSRQFALSVAIRESESCGTSPLDYLVLEPDPETTAHAQPSLIYAIETASEGPFSIELRFFNL